jgi:hypothetical protein
VELLPEVLLQKEDQRLLFAVQMSRWPVDLLHILR